MPAEDTAVIERRMYVDMVLGGVDDLSYSMSDLRNMTGGGVNAYRAAVSGLDASSPNGVFVPRNFERLVFSEANPSDIDAGQVINEEFAAFEGQPGRLILKGGVLSILTSIIIPTGCELVGLGPRVTELRTTTDMAAIDFKGGQAQGIRALKIQNTAAGTRTTFDIDITNPTKTVIEDVEIINSSSTGGNGGIYIWATTLDAGENAFMPQLSRVWIRSGRLRVDSVTDGHFTDGYVWATNRANGGAIELVDGVGGWTFVSVDVVPPLEDGAGYDLLNANNIQMVGGYIDGSYILNLTGHGLRATNSGRIFVSAYRFYNCGRSAIYLTNTHGCSFTGTGFLNNNKLDDSYPDIDLYSSTGNNFDSNVHTCYSARVNGGMMFRADGASNYNSVNSNSLDISLGVTYASPYAIGILTTFGSRNRPGVYWPRPLSAPNRLVPPASLFPSPATVQTWAVAASAILHRFNIEEGCYYRYARFYCGTASGNVQVAVLSLNTTSGVFTRVMNSGVVASVAGDQKLDMGQVYLNPGEYALALWCDNTTATFWCANHLAAGSAGLTSTLTAGFEAGIPSTGSPAWNGSDYVFGLTLSFS